jgi:dethiobiotin synthetase
MNGWFVTGTDTGVGKTRAACALIAALARTGRRVAGMKPVASGARATAAGPRHADAEALARAANVAAEYADVNPYCFLPAVAPHLAAEAAGVELRLQTVLDAYVRLRTRAEVVIAEGAGGWRVPLGPVGFMSDVARALALPVLLVVGVRLGCLNHAVLTLEAIRRDGAAFAGWVANGIEPEMPRFEDNVDALSRLLGAAPLAVFPHGTGGIVPAWPGPIPAQK